MQFFEEEQNIVFNLDFR